MSKEAKTLDERIDRIYKMAKAHYGEVRFVGIKRHTKIGWVAKIQFDEFDSLIAEGTDAIDALKKLRKRLKRSLQYGVGCCALTTPIMGIQKNEKKYHYHRIYGCG